MNRESLEKTLETGKTRFWSGSRKELWNKGATSRKMQAVKEVRFDCDAATLLLLVHAAGPACHISERTRFFRAIGQDGVVPL